MESGDVHEIRPKLRMNKGRVNKRMNSMLNVGNNLCKKFNQSKNTRLE